LKKARNKLQVWQDRLSRARAEYQDTLNKMIEWNAYYDGTRISQDDPNGGRKATRKSSNVRNIVYELIESQVDSTVPMPRVEAIHEEDKDLARNIEAVLRHEISLQSLQELNDLQERTVPIEGGSLWLVEWDPAAGTHCNLGDVKVTELHPKQVIPQPGVYELERMDYVFVQLAQTKEYIKERYGVDVSLAGEEQPEIRGDVGSCDDIVTQNIAYYKKDGKIGMFSWVDDEVLVDMDDYQARRLEYCKDCGAVKTGPVCECGRRRFEERAVTEQPVPEGLDIPRYTEPVEVTVTDVNGEAVLDESGAPIVQMASEETKIPCYNPGMYPIILRRNVRKADSFLGGSDVAVVMDQQDAIKKMGSKIDEKILKGGSFITLPDGVNIETTDREFKVVRVKSANEKALIGVTNVQPDVSKEMNALELNYQWAKSTLGITDAYQGKYDSSATSGTAKQFSANQAAGRLQSKREQKNIAFSRLYRAIFHYLLAYSDQPIPFSVKNPDGSTMYSHFNRWDFLKQDEAGEWYWNDEFIFTVDSSANTMTSRANLWEMLDLKYQAGAFGPLNDPQTPLRLWTMLEAAEFPYAAQVRALMAQYVEEQNAVSQMQSGNASEQPV
jgi:hypothetical protein